jgi:hypothetical protein
MFRTPEENRMSNAVNRFEMQRGLAIVVVALMASMASGVSLIGESSGERGTQSFIGTTPDAATTEALPPTF